MERTSRSERPGRPAGAACLIAAVLVAVAVGCSTEEPLPPRDGEADATERSRRIGSLLAEFERSTSGSREVQIHAQFLDVRGVEVGRALEALEVWSADRDLDPDTCRLEPTAAPTATESDMQLDLLSVGTIDVQGPAERLELEARRLPDVVDSFSGVVYGTGAPRADRSGAALGYRSGGRYTFRAEGDGSTGGFDASLRAPEPIRIRSRTGSVTPDGTALILGAEQSFRFRWNPTEETGHPVYFDITTGHEPGQPRLECRLEDDGAFSVPSELVGELAESSSTMRVSLRRISSRDVEIAGLQQSRFTLSTTDHLTLKVTERPVVSPAPPARAPAVRHGSPPEPPAK